MCFFDAHTHTQFAAFKDDWREVIERALKNNVWLVNIGTQKDTSARAVELAKNFPDGIYATVGLHPIHTEKSYHDEQELGVSDKKQETSDRGFFSREENFDYYYYKKLALDPKVVAIGECGLDYYQIANSKEQRVKSSERIKKQKEVFIKQIELAKDVGKPLMLHCRDGKKAGTGQAFDDLLNILKSSALTVPFVSHSFVRDLELAEKLLDLGSYFSFNGIITFTSDYDEVVRYVPNDRILSETDAPYLAPVPYRGKRNEPAYVIEVVKKLAELKNVPAEEMAERIFENAKRIFGLT